MLCEYLRDLDHDQIRISIKKNGRGFIFPFSFRLQIFRTWIDLYLAFPVSRTRELTLYLVLSQETK